MGAVNWNFNWWQCGEISFLKVGDMREQLVLRQLRTNVERCQKHDFQSDKFQFSTLTTTILGSSSLKIRDAASDVCWRRASKFIFQIKRISNWHLSFTLSSLKLFSSCIVWIVWGVSLNFKICFQRTCGVWRSRCMKGCKHFLINETFNGYHYHMLNQLVRYQRP